ncbi:MAG: V-type ATPase subunit [Deltaproteobacteria bacterium]|nr:MAG: V-type ATPase subunit [Deltaproteobacteria bacterium]
MIGDILSYLHVNAKIMAKEGKFISSRRWEDLCGCSSPGEIASLLEGTDYFPYLSERAINEAGELEKAILEEFSEVEREISKLIPKGAWPIKEYLLRRWDVINLRTVMRGIHGGLKKEEILDSFIVGGELDFAFLKALTDAEAMDDLVTLLARTPYRSLRDGLDKYNESKNLFFLEALLDKIFWEDLLLKVLRPRGLREFKDFVRISVETHNLKTILRAKDDRLSSEDTDPFLIRDCRLLNELLPAYAEEDLSGLINLLEDTIYFEPLLGGQHEYEKTSSILSFEEALDNLVLKKAEEIRKGRPFGPGPLIGFLVSKQKEVRNLLAIVRSSELDLVRDEIRESLSSLRS